MSFLLAKELEGCSERTIGYYEATLRHFNGSICLPVTQVDTETIREYLMRYQREHSVGKVTVDNIRRTSPASSRGSRTRTTS